MHTPSAEMYRELRSLARSLMRGERRGHTLSPTDLFHEAYTRLNPFLTESEKEIGEFRGLFAMTMRRVLVEHARKRSRRMRRLGRVAVPSDQFLTVLDVHDGKLHLDRLLDLDLALRRFSEVFPVHAQVVELKYFGGLTVAQCAEQLGIGQATVQRYWNFARAWIGREMEKLGDIGR